MAKVVIEKEQLDDAVFDAIEGLLTDGGHHKQYYLERVLAHIVGEEKMQEYKRANDWENGIPA